MIQSKRKDINALHTHTHIHPPDTLHPDLTRLVNHLSQGQRRDRLPSPLSFVYLSHSIPPSISSVMSSNQGHLSCSTHINPASCPSSPAPSPLLVPAPFYPLFTIRFPFSSPLWQGESCLSIIQRSNWPHVIYSRPFSSR